MTRSAAVSARFLWIALFAASAADCGIKLDVPESAQILCSTEGECPAGWVCLGGLCHESANLDTTAPDLSGPTVVTPAVGAAGQVFVFDLTTTEPTSVPPELVLGFSAPLALECPAIADTQYRCTYTAIGDENGGLGGTIGFDVHLRDATGNTTNHVLAGSFTLDFTAPAVAVAVVTYVAALDAANTAPTAATVGTTIEVTVYATEPIDVGLLGLVATSGGDVLSFVPTVVKNTWATFSATVVGQGDGIYVPHLSWRDVFGNTTTSATFATPSIIIKTSRPTLAVSQDSVTYLRSPWGEDQPETLPGGFVIPAGPYFALAPAEPLTGDTTLPPSTFTQSGGALVLLRVWGDAAATSLLKVVRPQPGGAWPRATLPALDPPSIFVTGVDEAGNESAPVKIANAEWVATPRAPPFGASPHAVHKTAFATRSRQMDESVTRPTTGATGSPGSLVHATADRVWRQEKDGPGPGPRSTFGSAYDSWRDRLVLFSGFDELGNPDDTWEWNGSVWDNRTPDTTSPSARTGHHMVFDSRRGRVVLFGGAAPTVANDVWEWDGSRWEDVTPSMGPMPAARANFAMAYDSLRGYAVIQGGEDFLGTPLDDTWAWTGSAWVNLAPLGSGPPARRDHGMTYDPINDNLVLFGGYLIGGSGLAGLLDDTWLWKDGAWQSKASGTPSARMWPSLVFDPVRGKPVLLSGWSGSGAYPEIWEWNGSSWSDVTPANGPSIGRVDHGGAFFHVGRGHVMTFSGYDTVTWAADFWEWTESTWRDVTTPAKALAGRTGHSMTYDAGRGVSIIVGGTLGWDSLLSQAILANDVIESTGGLWQTVSPATTSPSKRSAFAIAQNPTPAGGIVLFGGFDNANWLQDTWLWDGTDWQPTTIAGDWPTIRVGHAMAYDAGRNVTVLFGGDGGVAAGPWEWDGSAWSDATPMTGDVLGARAYPSLAYDGTRVVMFGGGPQAGGYAQDTWAWNGTTWSDLTSLSAQLPPARIFHAMAYDNDRGRMVLFGGQTNWDPYTLASDTWEWDGTDWYEVTPVLTNPGNRAFHAMTYDANRHRVVLYGGNSQAKNVWSFDADSTRTPSVQLDVSALAAGIDVATLTGLRVRARCGAVFAPYGGGDTGTALEVWQVGGTGVASGAWTTIATNNAGIVQGALAPDAAADLDGVLGNGLDARWFMTAHDRNLAVRCRPKGSSGTGVKQAEVALEKLEVRVRYQP